MMNKMDNASHTISVANQILLRDILENILEKAENPRLLSDYLTQQMRELLGGRTVVLIESGEVMKSGEHRIISVCPERHTPTVHCPEILELAEISMQIDKAEMWGKETGPLAAQQILTDKEWNDIAVLPLTFGKTRYGVLLVLNLFELHNIELLLSTMGVLTHSIALILKNSLLFENLERIIEHRTQELIQKERLFNRLTEISPVGIFRLNIGGKILYANERFCMLTGYKLEDVLLKEWTDFIHHEYHTNIQAQWVNNIPNKAIRSEFKFGLNNRWMLAEVVSEFDEKETVIGYIGTIIDITENKETEQALIESEMLLTQQNEEYAVLNEELNQSFAEIQQINKELAHAKEKAEESDRLKSAFLANMSHEIRTPMNAIIGFSDLLNNEHLSYEKRKRFTTVINQRTNDLLTIINDILDISKIESGTLRINKSMDNINFLINDIVEFFTSRNETLVNKPVQLIFSPTLKNEDAIIQADFSRLRQVFTNLIDNAYKFTHRGIIEIGYSCINDKDLLFYVKDPGIGISKEKQGVIFERFRQAHDFLISREYGGTGLGLTISKGIVELMGGRLWVESEEGVGSTFFFTLPFQKSIIEQPLPIKSSFPKMDWNGKTILIVEDIEDNIILINELLSDTNIVLLKAKDGKSALKHFNDNSSIDLILMDIRLPDINGFQLFERIKALNSKVPIIAQTAFASDEDKKKCLDMGFDGYLSKPINHIHLMQMLDSLLHK